MTCLPAEAELLVGRAQGHIGAAGVLQCGWRRGWIGRARKDHIGAN
jgi:hypothetical protein